MTCEGIVLFSTPFFIQLILEKKKKKNQFPTNLHYLSPDHLSKFQIEGWEDGFCNTDWWLKIRNQSSVPGFDN